MFLRAKMTVDILVLNCQKCNQCLNGHKSQALLGKPKVMLQILYQFHGQIALFKGPNFAT